MISLVVVQGAPGVGKSTFARRLSRDLEIRLITKDDIKELLYDTLGAPLTIAETKAYGRAAIRSMYAVAQECVAVDIPVMIEAPLEQQYALSDLGAIVSLDQILQVHVVCDPEEQVRRFERRLQNGERHSGHLDTAITVADARATQQRNYALEGIVTVTVDTTNFDEAAYSAALLNVRQYV